MRREYDAIRSLQRFFASFLPEPWDIRVVLEAGQEPVRPYALIEQVGNADTAGAKNVQDVTVAYTALLYLPEPSSKSRAAADDAALAIREAVWQAVKWGLDLRRPTPDRIPLYSYLPRPQQQRISVRGATSGTWRLIADGDETTPLAWNIDGAGLQAAVDLVSDGLLVVTRGRGVFDVYTAGARAGTSAVIELDDDLLVGAAAALTTVLEPAAAPWRSDRDFMRVDSFGQNTLRDPDNPALLSVAVDLRCAFARTLPLPFEQMLLQQISATTGSGG